MATQRIHPAGRRRLRSASRADGCETWPIGTEQFDVQRGLILDMLVRLDEGDGVRLATLIEVTGFELASPQRARRA